MQQTVFGRLEPWWWRSEGDGRAPSPPVGKGNIPRRAQIGVNHIYVSFSPVYCSFSPPQEGTYIHMYKYIGVYIHIPISVPASWHLLVLMEQ